MKVSILNKGQENGQSVVVAQFNFDPADAVSLEEAATLIETSVEQAIKTRNQKLVAACRMDDEQRRINRMLGVSDAQFARFSK